jgi:hypothetical protein
MIFPQLRQFGAGVNNGCIDALHSHFCLFLVDVGFVDTSRAAIADVKSAIFVVVTDPLPGVECPDPDPEPAGR